MNGLDWAVLIGYFGVMVAIGVWSHKRVDDVSDFFTAGGKMPWWLSGISHHMSGYSAVMFTGYAGIAYTYGVTSFATWSFPIALGIAIGSKLFAPRVNRLRSRLHVASPLEYLKNRYDLKTQQALVWSGMLLKIVDVGAEWAAIATLNTSARRGRGRSGRSTRVAGGAGGDERRGWRRVSGARVADEPAR